MCTSRYAGKRKVRDAQKIIKVFYLLASCFCSIYRRPRESRDNLLILFPLRYLSLAGHLYMYIAKFDLFFSASPTELTQQGLATGNPIAMLVAIMASTAIILFSHPLPSDEPEYIKPSILPIRIYIFNNDRRAQRQYAGYRYIAVGGGSRQ